MSIIIGGDLVPLGENIKLFCLGSIDEILGDELHKKWDSSIFKFFNLECPITDSCKKIQKCGPNIKCDKETIKGIKGLNPTCIMLANNHILDYGEQGIKDTLNILDRNNINYVGVGKNYDTLIKTFEFLCDDKKVAIYNCCEHEFSVATSNTYGANPYEEETVMDDIRLMKDKNDYVVIIYHGGKEHYRYPSPKLQKRCRSMVDAGANLVICQHSHCIGSEEKYKKSTIIYGQGNFVFNLQKNEYWNSSLLVEVDVKKDKIDYIPIVQTDYGARMADKRECAEIMKDFKKRSQQIKEDGFIKKEYKKYAEKEMDKYIIMVNGGRFIRIIHKIAPFIFRKIRFNYASILNVIECEAHNELFAEGLKNRISQGVNKE